jgi:hypothetical protein
MRAHSPSVGLYGDTARGEDRCGFKMMRYAAVRDSGRDYLDPLARVDGSHVEA